MANKSFKLNTKQAKPIVKATFPDYKGRKFKLEFTEHVTFWDTNWGGGTRNSYRAVRADGRIGDFPIGSPWDNPVEGASVDLMPEVFIVKHCIFCGQDLGITIYAHPSLAPRFLMEGN